MLGFALLAWNLSGLLSHQCTIANWSSDLGVMVCRIYKALMSFTITGMYVVSSLLTDPFSLPATIFVTIREILANLQPHRLSTLLALTLDILMHRKTSHRGNYNPMQDTKTISNPIFSDNPASSRSAYREPSLEFPEYSHEVKKPYRVQKPIEVQHFGYAAPTEQTSYGGPAADQGDLGLSKGLHDGYVDGGFV